MMYSMVEEISRLPSVAGMERVREYLAGRRMHPELLNDYRLTQTPTEFAERLSQLPECEFEQILDELIVRFPKPVTNAGSGEEPLFSQELNTEVLCSIAVYAFEKRAETRGSVKKAGSRISPGEGSQNGCSCV